MNQIKLPLCFEVKSTQFAALVNAENLSIILFYLQEGHSVASALFWGFSSGSAPTFALH